MKTEVKDQPSVLIVCEHASTKFGGEAILPWHYFRLLRRRGIDAWLVAHSRTRDELLALLPDDADRMHFTPDTRLNKLAWRVGDLLPARVAYITVGYLSRLQTQWLARKLARHLVADHGIEVVHQPMPVSPREPSLMYRVGAPVIIGPMNGNMAYPPAFAAQGRRKIEGTIVTLGRLASDLLNRLMPGKLRAAILLVANERTRVALPQGIRGEVITFVENGVDLELWSAPRDASGADHPPRFIFMGRLVDWKAVDILLDAFARVRTPSPPQLEIIGDGPMRAALEERAVHLGVSDRVRFTGWLPQTECPERLREADVLVLPSLYECGGAVVLEAMACGLPVIATAWGGPMDYLDGSCGILVPVDSREVILSGLIEAMTRLANDPGLRTALGRAGRERIEREFDWQAKLGFMIAIYQRAAARDARAAERRNPEVVNRGSCVP
jgi:glycosyltransferase involved in cell wall biosynthesis